MESTSGSSSLSSNLTSLCEVIKHLCTRPMPDLQRGRNVRHMNLDMVLNTCSLVIDLLEDTHTLSTNKHCQILKLSILTCIQCMATLGENSAPDLQNRQTDQISSPALKSAQSVAGRPKQACTSMQRFLRPYLSTFQYIRGSTESGTSDMQLVAKMNGTKSG